MNGTVCLRRVGVLSCAKIAGALYALLGLIIGAFVSLISLVSSAFAWSGASNGPGALFGALFGVGAIVLLPIVYGFFGFVGGLITGALYNMLAGVVGGVELDWGPPNITTLSITDFESDRPVTRSRRTFRST